MLNQRIAENDVHNRFRLNASIPSLTNCLPEGFWVIGRQGKISFLPLERKPFSTLHLHLVLTLLYYCIENPSSLALLMFACQEACAIVDASSECCEG